ncbi:MAG: hypothetical protein HZY79_13750 [Rhodoblastus sp.]|nr:MAG: hypothetical protein HZY79_13750 [Rhodoblastus sp.]
MFVALAFWTASFVGAAQAEVRFGRNVRIGGRHVAPQTFSQQRRGVFYLYDREPRNPGCRWVATREGRAKVCHWRRLRR